MYVQNVFLVPQACQNLVNVGQMLENNYTILFKNKACTIIEPNGSVLMTVNMKNKCFPRDWHHIGLNVVE